MTSNPLEPFQILRSFMVVATGYLMSNFFWGGSLMLLIATDRWFPEAHRIWALPNAAFKEQIANAPYDAVPAAMFCCVLVAGLTGSVLAGYCVARTAPFAHFGHVVFAAVLVGVSWLQQLLAGNSPQALRWMVVVSMISMAAAMLIGGKLGLRGFDSDDSPATMEDDQL